MKKKKNSKKGQSKTFPFYTLLLPMFNNIDALSSIFFWEIKFIFSSTET